MVFIHFTSTKTAALLMKDSSNLYFEIKSCKIWLENNYILIERCISWPSMYQQYTVKTSHLTNIVKGKLVFWRMRCFDKKKMQLWTPLATNLSNYICCFHKKPEKQFCILCPMWEEEEHPVISKREKKKTFVAKCKDGKNGNILLLPDRVHAVDTFQFNLHNYFSWWTAHWSLIEGS